jgi:hypothetical protein
MKRKLIIICLLALAGWRQALAQTEEIASLWVNLDKLAQLEGTLSSMKKGYETIKGGYTTIKGISEGNFRLHQVFLDGLLQVSPTVKKYYKIPEIISCQLNLAGRYKHAYQRFKLSGNFTPEELRYFGDVYSGLINQSLTDLDDLITVLTAGKLRMTDDERLKSIDKIHTDMMGKVTFLENFNNDIALRSLQREKEKFARQTVENLYRKPDKH